MRPGRNNLWWPRWRKYPAVLVLASWGAVGAAGQADLAGSGTLVSVSPFAAPAGASAEGGANPQFELRGLSTSTEGRIFSIADLGSKTSAWLHVNEPWHGVTIRSYEQANGIDTVVLERNGVAQRLKMRQSKIATSEAVTGASSPGGQFAAPGQPPGEPARQILPGIPDDQLSAAEKGKLTVLMTQIRIRLAQEKRAGKAKAPASSDSN